MTTSFDHIIQEFSKQEYNQTLTGIGRGVERETLRILPEGKLSEQPHNSALGSALTHPLITTDYAENLLEFITPVSGKVETTIAQLQDIQKYTLSQIGNELLWPMSMPCYVDDENKIPLAQYGTSNIGKMKTVYRQGLKNRYGSMMQIIAGIHFNFSFSTEFWQSMQKITQSNESLQQTKSVGYFSLIRNYKRYSWLIPYLFGSSPVICSSFLQGKESSLPFKKSPQGYCYLPYATSLRMSDLGYTNNVQSKLNICYNSVESYVKTVQQAIGLPSEKFAKIGVKKNGIYQQLNTNVLQIENELYAPIRPKRVTLSGERPSHALSERGVEYIEVRSLDVNPFVDTGISTDQMYFLDVFLTYCALKPSPEFTQESHQRCIQNMNLVVVNGRDPELLLDNNNQKTSVKQWGKALFDDFSATALLLDKAYNTHKYSQAVNRELAKINDSSLTPSAKIEESVIQGSYNGLALATRYKKEVLARDYQEFSLAHFEQLAEKSRQDQLAIEQSDSVPFDQFLHEYFNKN